MGNVSPEERELLQGMGNCYAACHATFEETVEMVGGSRGLKPSEVKKMLIDIRTKHHQDEEYKALRSRFPEEFAA